MSLSNKAALQIRGVLKFASVLVCIALFPQLSWAQSSESPVSRDSDGIEAPADEAAPVIVDGKTLFLVVGTTSLPAKERADNIEKRIVKAASDRSLDVSEITTFDKGDGTVVIAAGESLLVTLIDEDAAIEGLDIATLSFVVHGSILKAVTGYRFDRSRAEIIRSTLFSLGALILAVLVAFFIRWILKKANTAIERRIGKVIQSMENKSFHLVQSNQIWRVFHALFNTIKNILILIVLLSAVFYCLNLFPWTRGASGLVLQKILDPLAAAGKAFVAYLPSLALLIVIVVLSRYLVKILKLLFKGISEGRIRVKSIEPEMALPAYSIVRLLVLMFAMVVAYPYIPGSQSPAFKALSVFAGVLISLGSSSFIGNVVAGYSMTFRKAFRKGDRILVDGNVGFVEEQKTMVTRIRTIKNEEIVMPNSVLINSSIVNYSSRALQTGIILHSSVNIGYEIPWRQVDAILMLAADRTAKLEKEPVPFVLKKSLGEIGIEYEINGYCKDPTVLPQVYDELHGHMLDLFNENSIQIMRPSYEGDPDTPKIVPKEQWHTPAVSSDPDDVPVRGRKKMTRPGAENPGKILSRMRS